MPGELGEGPQGGFEQSAGRIAGKPETAVCVRRESEGRWAQSMAGTVGCGALAPQFLA